MQWFHFLYWAIGVINWFFWASYLKETQQFWEWSDLQIHFKRDDVVLSRLRLLKQSTIKSWPFLGLKGNLEEPPSKKRRNQEGNTEKSQLPEMSQITDNRESYTIFSLNYLGIFTVHKIQKKGKDRKKVREQDTQTNLSWPRYLTFLVLSRGGIGT